MLLIRQISIYNRPYIFKMSFLLLGRIPYVYLLHVHLGAVILISTSISREVPEANP